MSTNAQSLVHEGLKRTVTRRVIRVEGITASNLSDINDSTVPAVCLKQRLSRIIWVLVFSRSKINMRFVKDLPTILKD